MAGADAEDVVTKGGDLEGSARGGDFDAVGEGLDVWTLGEGCGCEASEEKRREEVQTSAHEDNQQYPCG